MMWSSPKSIRYCQSKRNHFRHYACWVFHNDYHSWSTSLYSPSVEIFLLSDTNVDRQYKNICISYTFIELFNCVHIYIYTICVNEILLGNWLHSYSNKKPSAHTEKTIFPVPSTLNGIWSWWQFSFRFNDDIFTRNYLD